MSLKSILQNRNRKRIFRKIRQGKRPILNLPPYERGLYYEDEVCRWLKKKGYRILDRNYRAKKRTEIDIIAKDKEMLVFIEVKARRKDSVYDPLQAIDERKREALALATVDYLKQLSRAGIDTDEISFRFDAVAVYLDSQALPVKMDHYLAYLVPSYETV